MQNNHVNATNSMPPAAALLLVSVLKIITSLLVKYGDRAKTRAGRQVVQLFAPQKTEEQCRTIIREWVRNASSWKRSIPAQRPQRPFRPPRQRRQAARNGDAILTAPLTFFNGAPMAQFFRFQRFLEMRHWISQENRCAIDEGALRIKPSSLTLTMALIPSAHHRRIGALGTLVEGGAANV